jgi:hypothetical protein
MPVSLDDQIACVRRELALRRNVYKRRVLDKKMTQEVADRELVHMDAVLETLNTCLTLTHVLERLADEASGNDNGSIHFTALRAEIARLNQTP